jgi:hypothetical protein
MSAPTKPNAELAYRVLDHIDASPELWNQGVYIGKRECGTVACFAGWAVLLSGATPKYYGNYNEATDSIEFDRRVWSAPDLAEELLGASRWVEAGDGESDDIDLFAEENTRDDLDRLVAEIFGPRPDGAR